VTQRDSFKTASNAWPIGALLITMTSFQCGAALAKGLFPAVGAVGTAALRLALGSLMMVVVFQPWRLRVERRLLTSILLYGAAMGAMNTSFYLAIARIPLGITVAIEFLGPLGVALWSLRRPLDLAWVLLAGLGVWGLTPWASAGPSLAADGIAYALGAGVCWALYIVFAQRTGGAHAGRSAALGTLLGALLVVPLGLAEVGPRLFAPRHLPVASAVALLSTAAPYTLELYALTRLPARTYGVLASLAPALGALAGLVFLHERLSQVQWLAIAGIVLASAGVAATTPAVRVQTSSTAT
jgi:inner membrane transporter RhtA